MTFMKSLLLGSGAAIVAVAGAQAADLPTKKAAPAEYVKICNVGGMAGFVIPGSDTCLKIGGSVTAHIEAGNIKTEYNLVKGTTAAAKTIVTNATTASNVRDGFGFLARGDITFDARQNTAYGVLRSYIDIQSNNGAGYESSGVYTDLNLGYIQWAGITAGRVGSFFSYLA